MPLRMGDPPSNSSRPPRWAAIRRALRQAQAWEEQVARLEEQSTRSRVDAEQLGLALVGGNIGTWDWNPSTGELEVNETWVEISGLDRSKLRGHTDDWANAVHPEDLPAALAALERHFSGETEFYEATFRKRRSNGEQAWMLSRGKVVAWDDEWNPVRMVGIEVDRTEEVERGLENKRLREASEASSQAKSEFLANMSHEIRTPLTAILGYAELFSSGTEPIEDPDRVRKMLTTIQHAGDHLLSIINDILDLSKIEAERLEIEALEADLGKELRNVADMIRPRIEGKGVEFRIEFGTSVPAQVHIDVTRLRQILVNILGNAAKFTEEGRVTLRIALREGLLCFEVEDTGRGISPSQAEVLFQPFCQGDTSVTRHFGGTGLGLSISRRLAQLMDGEVVLVRSVVGVGSVFLVTLPCATVQGAEEISSVDAEEVPCARSNPVEAPLCGAHVLLVEDGAVNQRLISSILLKAGAEVTVANDGLEALDRIDELESSFSIVLSDMQMPRMDGYTLASRLRADGFQVPIIALTAHTMAEDRGRCLDAGCSDYAAKPIDRPKLLETCARWIEYGRAQAA